MVLPTDPPLPTLGMRADLLPATMAVVAAADEEARDPAVLGRAWALPSIGEWRSRDRIKTVSVALVLCMNIGVGPPDAPKPANAAKLHAWTDPFKDTPPKALEAIAKALQAQYEVLQVRARYRLALDPAVEDTKKLCVSLRRSAKDERVLFHYNGHGVPKPTPSGELWVFNKTYTQYIPVSVYDLQTWLGAPAIFVWDCSAAGNILLAFNQFVAQRDAEQQQQLDALLQQHLAPSSVGTAPAPGTTPGSTANGAAAAAAGPESPAPPPPRSPPVPSTFAECIQLAACGPGETLPWNADLPADVFTACLTTPIQMALRWFLLTHPHARARVTLEQAAAIPGRLGDRRTPLGELNWIFTAVTDTIAWSVLPRDMFRRLFRQDLLVAGLFRNFLLAQRVLKSYGCNPLTSPALPETDKHPLWAAWDMVVDLCIDQFPDLLAPGSKVEFIHSTFFAEQLTAFDIWLSQGALADRPPLQLPIVLQVLLSQHHRLRALIILSRFLDLGPWAVSEALQVGIFPYVLKLLQSPAPELKPILVFIWTRILAVDPASCQADLMKDNGFTYFIHVLSPSANLAAIQDVSEHRAMCAFILSTLCHGFRDGQAACLHHSVLPLCQLYLGDPDDLLRQWACICIAQVCHQYSDAILAALEDGMHARVAACLADTVTEVRAGAVLALGTFLQLASPQLQPVSLEMVTALLPTLADASPLVRGEAVIALACFLSHHRAHFEALADQMIADRAAAAAAATSPTEPGKPAAPTASSGGNSGKGTPTKSRLAALVSVPASSIFDSVTSAVWKLLLMASVDPDRAVAVSAQRLVDAVLAKAPIYPPCSLLFEKRRRYFAEPQIQPAEHRQPGSVRDLERRWTFERNRSLLVRSRAPCLAAVAADAPVITSTAAAVEPAEPARPAAPAAWQQAVTFPVASPSTTSTVAPAAGPVRAIRVHAFEDVVYVANGTNVGVWEIGGLTHPPPGSSPSLPPPPLDAPTRLWSLDCSSGSDGAPRIPVTAVELIHEDAYSLLAAASADGTVRVWRDVVPYRSAYRKQHGDGAARDAAQDAYADDAEPALDRELGNWFTRSLYVAPLRKPAAGTRRSVRSKAAPPQADSLVVPSIATSWRAAPDLTAPRVPARRTGSASVADTPAVVLKWISSLGALAVAGPARTVRLWDLERDQPAHTVHTRSAAAVTGITSDALARPHVLVAGGADGAVRVLDVRLRPTDALVHTLREHAAWCVGVDVGQHLPPLSAVAPEVAAAAAADGGEVNDPMQSAAAGLVVSASAAGDVRVWDMRHPARSVLAVDAFANNASLSAFALHPYAPLAAAGSATQQCKLFDITPPPPAAQGQQQQRSGGKSVLHTITHYDGFLGQRLGKVTALAFHPLLPTLAMGAGTAAAPVVTLYRTSNSGF
ncbi:Target of rapamycin complex 1 subunit kog1 [Blastocladiella emersonii ATCC 22665]|nr:Target of rapamycin complex 1 subunit kog1 [Blastocladiella emersonii ATCC 22665]